MNKKDISEIKEVINHILEYRNKEIYDNEKNMIMKKKIG